MYMVLHANSAPENITRRLVLIPSSVGQQARVSVGRGGCSINNNNKF